MRREHVRFVTEDVASHPGFVGTADGEAAHADGIRAAQSTPLATSTFPAARSRSALLPFGMRSGA